MRVLTVLLLAGGAAAYRFEHHPEPAAAPRISACLLAARRGDGPAFRDRRRPRGPEAQPVL